VEQEAEEVEQKQGVLATVEGGFLPTGPGTI